MRASGNMLTRACLGHAIRMQNATPKTIDTVCVCADVSVFRIQVSAVDYCDAFALPASTLTESAATE